jgi:hypothetical protein
MAALTRIKIMRKRAADRRGAVLINEYFGSESASKSFVSAPQRLKAQAILSAIDEIRIAAFFQGDDQFAPIQRYFLRQPVVTARRPKPPAMKDQPVIRFAPQGYSLGSLKKCPIVLEC